MRWMPQGGDTWDEHEHPESKVLKVCKGLSGLKDSVGFLYETEPFAISVGFGVHDLEAVYHFRHVISINHPIVNHKGLQHQASEDTLLTSIGVPNQLVSFSPANFWGQCWWRFLKAVEFEIGRMLLRCIIFHGSHCSTTFQWTRPWQEMIFSHCLEVLEQSSSETKKCSVGGSWSGIRMRRWRDEDVGKSPLTKAQSFIINDCFYCVIPFNSGRRVLLKRRCVIWRLFKSLWKEWLSTPKCNGLSLPSFAILVELQVTEMFPNQKPMMFFLEPSWLTLVTVKYIIWSIRCDFEQRVCLSFLFIYFYISLDSEPLVMPFHLDSQLLG